MLYLENVWELFVDMSFYIVIGLLLTGALNAFVKKEVILKHVGKKTTSSVVKASVFGVPLPLCSCGVVPTALYLGKNGASKGAVVSFLTSTPQTGVDSIVATYGLMGPLLAIYRALAAFLSGIISGIVTNLFCREEKSDAPVAVTSGCGCGCKSESSSDEIKQKTSVFAKIKSIFTFAFGEFLDDIAVHFVVGLLIAALISTLVPDQLLSGITNPIVSMLLMLVIGIPMYICSTASIPIALSFIMKGISPGAAFVFLFAGPVTNIASLTILAKTLGKKVLAIYLSCAAVCAVLFGLLLDYIIVTFNYTGIDDLVLNTHAHSTPIYMTVTAILFGVLVLRSIVKKYLGRRNNKKSCCSKAEG